MASVIFIFIVIVHAAGSLNVASSFIKIRGFVVSPKSPIMNHRRPHKARGWGHDGVKLLARLRNEYLEERRAVRWWTVIHWACLG